MDIRNTRALKDTASQRLDQARDAGKIVLIYAGITLTVSLLVTLVNYTLDLQISKTGGLGSIGTRSVLATIQTVLPIVQMAAMMCLELGYLAAAMRIARGQYVSPQTLRAGMPRFWAMVRCGLLQALIFMGVGLLSFYLAMQIFLFTPLSNDAMRILMPLAGDSSVLSSGALILEEATQMQLTYAMLPMFVLMLVIFAVAATPLVYQYRMASYVLLDKPAYGALAALRESRGMMRRNRFKLFRLDLSLWWYYLLTALCACVCYGDQILPLLGVRFPFSDVTAFFLFYGAYLVLQFAVFLCFLNRVEVTYALAYDSLRPPEPKTEGVVLGNIFNM